MAPKEVQLMVFTFQRGSGVRRKAVAGISVFAMVLIAVVLQSATARGGDPALFSIDSFSAQLRAGDTLNVTGSGCPPTGSLPSEDALVLRLTPPSGGNAFGPSLIDGSVQIVGTTAASAGEAQIGVSPNVDGTFEAALPIPLDAPSGAGYTVRGICTSLLEAGGGQGGFTQTSYDSALAFAGTLDVEGPVEVPPIFIG